MSWSQEVKLLHLIFVTVLPSWHPAFLPSVLPLSLFVFRVFANYGNSAFSFNTFAFFANFLYWWSYFHFLFPFILIVRCVFFLVVRLNSLITECSFCVYLMWLTKHFDYSSIQFFNNELFQSECYSSFCQVVRCHFNSNLVSG